MLCFQCRPLRLCLRWGSPWVVSLEHRLSCAELLAWVGSEVSPCGVNIFCPCLPAQVFHCRYCHHTAWWQRSLACWLGFLVKGSNLRWQCSRKHLLQHSHVNNASRNKSNFKLVLSVFSTGSLNLLIRTILGQHGVVGECSEGIGKGHFGISCWPNNWLLPPAPAHSPTIGIQARACFWPCFCGVQPHSDVNNAFEYYVRSVLEFEWSSYDVLTK